MNGTHVSVFGGATEAMHLECRPHLDGALKTIALLDGWLDIFRNDALGVGNTAK